MISFRNWQKSFNAFRIKISKNKIKSKEYLYECQDQEKEIDKLTKLIKSFEINVIDYELKPIV